MLSMHSLENNEDYDILYSIEKGCMYMKRILIILLSMLVMSSVCFAEENDNTLNPKEQYVYDSVDQIVFNDPESVRFRSVSKPFEEAFCPVTIAYRNEYGGMSMKLIIFRYKKIDLEIDTDSYDPSDPDIDLKKLNRVWRLNHQDE